MATPEIDLDRVHGDYRRDGYAAPVNLMTPREAARHRAALERAEAEVGNLHYKPKIHTILRSPFELATLPVVLDIVERLVGPDILLYNATYIIKEPGTASHVSWHQDLPYWGLSQDDQVTMWLALSPATAESGCMRMIPASHTNGHVEHEVTEDASNVLYQGQTVRGIDEQEAVMCPLRPGQASFHHGWTLHASMPNNSNDRRIGLNVQYIAAHVRQTKHDLDSAMLVRGRDDFHHFETDIAAGADFEPTAMARQVALEDRYRQIAGTS